MLRDRLTPIDLQSHMSIEEAAQACALMYLSYYTEVAWPARCKESYRRAWGLNDILIFQRTGDFGGLHRPGFIAAVWNENHIRRLVIAIHGLTDWRQMTRGEWWSINPFFFAENYHGSGKTAQAYINHANRIWTDIHGNAQLAALLAVPNMNVTFAGHSFGAAIAELLAVRMKVTQPAKMVRLAKFGSPRVGDRAWVDGNARRFPRVNVYCGRDPVHMIPSFAVATTLNNWNPFETWRRPFHPEDSCMNITLDHGGWSVGYPPGFVASHARMMEDQLRPMTSGNGFYEHDHRSYRMAFMQQAATVQDALELRMNYLEGPTENAWQERFLRGDGRWDFEEFNTISDPPPADHAPGAAAQVEAVVAPPPPMVVPDQQVLMRDGRVLDRGHGEPPLNLIPPLNAFNPVITLPPRS